GVVVGADHQRIALLDGHGLQQVQALALWDALENVDQDHVGQFLRGNPVGRGRAHVASSDNRYLLTHVSLPFGSILVAIAPTRSYTAFCLRRSTMFSMMCVANSLVLTLVDPGISRSKS